MKIAYFNYVGDSLPALVRSFELTHAAAALGETVGLFLLHEKIRQPGWFFSMLEKSASERFRVVFNPSARREYSSKPSGAYSIRFLVPLAARSLRFVPREIEYLRSYKPDVIVVRPDHVLSFLITSKLLSLPLVFCTDGPVEELAAIHGFTPRWPIAIDAWRARRADAITVISETCRRLWLDKGIPEKKLFTCPNGVDPDVFRPLPRERRRALRAELGIPERGIVIGFAGNQRFWHGLHLLFEAFTELAARDNRLHLLVAGPLEDRSTAGLETVPAATGERIRFTGHLDYRRMPGYLDCMDLFVMPYPRFTIFHFSPMKMFESLSMGKIIVASGQGQIAEMLRGLPSAFLYDPDDKNALTEKLREAIEAFTGRPRLGDRSRDFIIGRHTWRTRAGALLAACRFALETRATR